MEDKKEMPTDQLLACPACSQEMQCDDEGTLPLHVLPGVVNLSSPTCPGSYGPGRPSRSGAMIRPPYVPAQIDAASATEALIGQECWGCGQPKRRGNGLCKRCFRSVPLATIGVFLYLPVGEGFEKAFAEGLEHLKQQHKANSGGELFSGSAAAA